MSGNTDCHLSPSIRLPTQSELPRLYEDARKIAALWLRDGKASAAAPAREEQ
jgi:hypothetical protein